MSEPFQIAGGSVAGHHHVAAGRNNQDAFAWQVGARGAVVVVCDGCGSGAHSEVGAKLGAQLVVQTAVALLDSGAPAGAELCEEMRRQLLARLRVLALGMAEDPRDYIRVVADYFLFTIVGAILTADRVVPFSLGDGVLVVNGARRVLGPFADNQPPYLGYALLPPASQRAGIGAAFEVHPEIPTDEVESLLVGTDGVCEVEALEPFWQQAGVFANRDMARRRLVVLNRRPGGRALGDDTTLVVVRRAPVTETAGSARGN